MQILETRWPTNWRKHTELGCRRSLRGPIPLSLLSPILTASGREQVDCTLSGRSSLQEQARQSNFQNWHHFLEMEEIKEQMKSWGKVRTLQTSEDYRANNPFLCDKLKVKERKRLIKRNLGCQDNWWTYLDSALEKLEDHYGYVKFIW